ncbi:MAG: Pyruvoyl-dependent arginine decarboxylase [Myxococcota bacterium]|nr:Pyruvoyl-dependent arginine decarboxylase [Myxococcota bacterium]
MDFVAKRMFFTKGVGVHDHRLSSFELALRDAGIASLNLVRVSSIFPPHCKILTKAEGVKRLKHGQIAFAIMADISTNEPNRLIAASIGVARPRDATLYGYLSEHHSYGETAKKAGDFAEDLAAEMLGSTLGIEVDPNLAWHEKENVYKASGMIIETKNFTQSAEGNKDGKWTTVVACAILLIDS